MKTILNERIKGREWYRPFAAVVRLEDQGIYFDITIPVPYMSVVGRVRNEWIGKYLLLRMLTIPLGYRLPVEIPMHFYGIL